MSTNTSTLIPALQVLGIPYHPYFDERPVVESQNDITFYWKPSRLAAFYNRFSTDELDYADREPVIRRAVEFLISNDQALPLPEEHLARMQEPVRLLGFHQGFPIFDGSTGFAKLLSRLGIHIDAETVMISTPLDKYEGDIYELAEALAQETGLDYSKKKNRVIFPKDDRLLKILGNLKPAYQIPSGSGSDHQRSTPIRIMISVGRLLTRWAMMPGQVLLDL